MVLSALRARLSTLWSDEPTEETQREPTTADEESGDEHSQDETLSYAEDIEYGVDERDLQDDDKILRLLVKRGGRVDEETVREETGWTKEHLAEVIDGMEDENQVSAITVGRKRVICRRGFEPKGYRSHLNE